MRDNLEKYKRRIDIMKIGNSMIDEATLKTAADYFDKVDKHLGYLFDENKVRDGKTKKLIFDCLTVLFAKCKTEEELASMCHVLDKYCEEETKNDK